VNYERKLGNVPAHNDVNGSFVTEAYISTACRPGVVPWICHSSHMVPAFISHT